MTARLRFPDPRAAADTLTFVGRAARMADGLVRLHAADGTLVVTAAALAPLTLVDDTPTILGLRMLPIDPELSCDLVIEASTLTATADAHELALPDHTVSAAWAGISPPRGGWTEHGAIGADDVARAAQWGITAVARALPAVPGEEIVHRVRAEVWGAPDEALDALPRGAAFAAHTLGFIGGAEDVRILVSGPWTRLTLRRGHVLVRRRVHTGLTEVRRTGTA